jgi:perosamine synthetase
LWKQKIQNVFTPQPTTEKTFISLSVRSTFDIYLQCRNFPRGTEVLMTAINIPDMVQILNEHGLVPVPVDVDPYTLAPTLELVKAACTENTKVCIFAYIYGVTFSIEPFAEFLHSQNIDIIEDCAQSWRSLDAFRGSKHALLTMFSFGTIKLNTAFYGSVTIVREGDNFEKLKQLGELSFFDRMEQT